MWNARGQPDAACCAASVWSALARLALDVVSSAGDLEMGCLLVHATCFEMCMVIKVQLASRRLAVRKMRPGTASGPPDAVRHAAPVWSALARLALDMVCKAGELGPEVCWRMHHVLTCAG